MDKFIPAEEASAEYEVQKSRFIASAAPVFSAEEARLFISSIKKKYCDATHNVPAFIIGEGNSIVSGCSDDGEPSGTSGRPALSVLEGSTVTNIAVVITRYFGGIKLGTGGLVRAYSESVKRVLAVLPKARIINASLFQVMLPYSFYEPFLRLASSEGAEICSSEFDSDVILTVKTTSLMYKDFSSKIIDMTNGSAVIEIIKENYEDIVRVS